MGYASRVIRIVEQSREAVQDDDGPVDGRGHEERGDREELYRA